MELTNPDRISNCQINEPITIFQEGYVARGFFRKIKTMWAVLRNKPLPRGVWIDSCFFSVKEAPAIEIKDVPGIEITSLSVQFNTGAPT